MKTTRKIKSAASKTKKTSKSKAMAHKSQTKSASKSTAKKVAKPAKKKIELKKKPTSPSHSVKKNAKSFSKDKDKHKNSAAHSFKSKKAGSSKTAAHSKPSVKSHKKEIKIEVSSFKKEHLKKQELKRKEQEKQLELKQQKLKEEKKAKKQPEKKAELVAKSNQEEIVKPKKSEAKTQQKETKPQQKETKKAKATKAKDEDELDDDFISDGDGSEIDEYEEDLKAVEEVDEETEETLEFEVEAKEKNFEEINLTDAEGNLLCRSRDCDQVANVEGYCRYHYLLYWKRIQVRKKILADGKLERYVEELTSRYPDKFLEMIRRDLRTQKDFVSAIQELEIDESNLENDYEEDTQTYIDEVRGINESTSLDEEFE